METLLFDMIAEVAEKVIFISVRDYIHLTMTCKRLYNMRMIIADKLAKTTHTTEGADTHITFSSIGKVRHGLYIIMSGGGIVRYTINYVLGKRHGLEGATAMNGRNLLAHSFNMDKREGTSTTYSSDGSYEVRQYKNDRLDGMLCRYGKNGELVASVTYVDGYPI
jgi:antitoxin component YwqK of YwqJK toxin-antitoxin module